MIKHIREPFAITCYCPGWHWKHLKIENAHLFRAAQNYSIYVSSINWPTPICFRHNRVANVTVIKRPRAIRPKIRKNLYSKIPRGVTSHVTKRPTMHYIIVSKRPKHPMAHPTHTVDHNTARFAWVTPGALLATKRSHQSWKTSKKSTYKKEEEKAWQRPHGCERSGGTTGGPCSRIFIQAYCPPDSQYCLYTGYNYTLRNIFRLVGRAKLEKNWMCFQFIHRPLMFLYEWDEI
jgi:hypothetical protein